MKRGGAFVCAGCGAVHAKWSGRCDACGAWNTIAEEPTTGPGPRRPGRGRRLPLGDLAGAPAARAGRV